MSNCRDQEITLACFTPTDGNIPALTIKHVTVFDSYGGIVAAYYADVNGGIDISTYLGGGTATLGSCSIGGSVSSSVAPQTYWELDPLNPDPDNPLAIWSGYWDGTMWVVVSGTPLDPANNFVQEACCDGGTVDPLALVTAYYLETCIMDYRLEPTVLADSVTGHGYLQRTSYTASQFINEGDAGGGLEAPHSIITEDHDGVRQIEEAAEVLINNLTTATLNEGGSNGQLNVFEGAIYRPEYYHLGANAGKRVTTFRLYDAYTTTTQSDSDRIQLGVSSGYPSLDRSDLTVVAEAQVGVSFDLPAAWAGQWSALAIEHSDKGLGSQINMRVHIELDDGTILTNRALNDWVWNIETKENAPTPDQPQVVVLSVTDPATGITTWSKDGVTVPYEDLCQPVQTTTSTYLPISFDTIAIGDEITIVNAALGSGGPYEYSFDGGITWQASNTFSLGDTSDGTEVDILAVLPRVRDSGGTESGILGAETLLGDPVDNNGAPLRTADLEAGVLINTDAATISTNPDDAGGWVTNYGTLTEVVPTDDLTDWAIVGTALPSAAYLQINNGVTSVGSFTGTYALAGVIPNGDNGVVEFDLRNYYYGNPATDIDAYIEIVDNVTNAVLASYHVMDNDNFDGTEDVIFNENTFQSFNNIKLEYISAGNAVNFQIRDLTSGGTDTAGHYLAVGGIKSYAGNFVDASHYFRSGGTYIQARGIDAPMSDPATLVTGIDDVSMSDLIRLTGNIQRIGTHVAGTDGFSIEYSLDNGPWISIFDHTGNWDIANQPYLTPYQTETIDVSASSTIRQRLSVWSDGSVNKYWRIHDMRHEEVSA